VLVPLVEWVLLTKVEWVLLTKVGETGKEVQQLHPL